MGLKFLRVPSAKHFSLMNAVLLTRYDYAELVWILWPRLDLYTQNVIFFCKSFAWYTKCSRKINRITKMNRKSRDESNESN